MKVKDPIWRRTATASRPETTRNFTIETSKIRRCEAGWLACSDASILTVSIVPP